MQHLRNAGPISHERRLRNKVEAIFARKNEIRQKFMKSKVGERQCKDKQKLKELQNITGPPWYQVLSPTQIKILESLPFAIKYDLLLGKLRRVPMALTSMGVEFPNNNKLFECVEEAAQNPMMLFACIYYDKYRCQVHELRSNYEYNAKILLSSIFHLGLPRIKELLEIIFKGPEVPKKRVKKKKKEKIVVKYESPYLEKLTFEMYEVKKPEPFVPTPLPPLSSLEFLDELFLKKPLVCKKPASPPHTPPWRKKRIPVSECDDIADYHPFRPPPPPPVQAPEPPPKKHRRRKKSPEPEKKKYGLCNMPGVAYAPPPKSKPRIPRKVKKSMKPNKTFLIAGVYLHKGKPLFVIGGVCMLPIMGFCIHGGHQEQGKVIMNENIIEGIKFYDPLLSGEGCMKRCTCKDLESQARRTLEATRCTCNHNYDLQHEISSQVEVPEYFHKAKNFAPHYFDYYKILNIDDKFTFLQEELAKIWDTDSLFGNNKKNKKDISNLYGHCLGKKPNMMAYLKCACKYIFNDNIAAQLPHIYYAPELKEWMRFRMYGPLSQTEKKQLMNMSAYYWLLLQGLPQIAKLPIKADPRFSGASNKITFDKSMQLKKDYNQYVHKYKKDLVEVYHDYNNIVWATTYWDAQPLQSFRELFFSYVIDDVNQLNFLHPYDGKFLHDHVKIQCPLNKEVLDEFLD